MVMTRKDYRAFAQEIAEIRATLVSPAELMVLDRMVDSMCVVFHQDNSRFDRQKFLAATGRGV